VAAAAQLNGPMRDDLRRSDGRMYEMLRTSLEELGN
jgi:hypothetical protein